MPILELGMLSDTEKALAVLNSRTWMSVRNIVGQSNDEGDPTTDPTFFQTPQEQITFNGFDFLFDRFLNLHDVFCELWIAKCPLVGIYMLKLILMKALKC